MPIEHHTGEPHRPFKEFGPVHAKVGTATVFSKNPTIENLNLKLQEKVSKLGANAVIGIEYNHGISMTSWKSLDASVVAVIFKSDQCACPTRAEQIKRAARKCRYCASDFRKVARPEWPNPDTKIKG